MAILSQRCRSPVLRPVRLRLARSAAVFVPGDEFTEPLGRVFGVSLTPAPAKSLAFTFCLPYDADAGLAALLVAQSDRSE